MTVYRRNPLLMTVMGANPGGPAFIVADSITGRVMYTKRATGVGSEAINSCAAKAQMLARRNGRSYIVFLDMSRARVGGSISIPWARTMGITEEVHPDGSVTRGNPPRRRKSGDNEIDSMIGAAWARFMSGVQVSVMEIPKIFRDIKLEMAGGMTLEDAVRVVGSRYRVNHNPLGEAIVAGATGALINRAFQSNPHLEDHQCATCGGSLSYLGTLGNREHYRCRNCGMDVSTPVVGASRPRQYRKLCVHGAVTNLCRACRGRKMTAARRACVHGRADATRCLQCLRHQRPGGPVRNNPAIRSEWDRLTGRRRLAVLEFAGIEYEQARRLAHRPWSTLPPSIQDEVAKGWQENPKYRVRHLSPEMESREGVIRARGLKHALKKAHQQAEKLPPRFTAPRSSVEVERYEDNPGRGGKRKMTMTIERFADWVKSKRDPAMWKAFLAKFRGYEKWTHGAKARKVTVEWVDTPGVNGLWITYDGGKQPESTYIMPKGSPRKGAWKHPWDTMPDIKHDPEAKIVITKLRGSSKITDFYHK